MLSSALLILAGVAAGVVSGLLGVGGGVILVPIFIHGFKMNPHTAIGTSLLIIVPTALMGAWRHYAGQAVDFRVFLIVTIGTLLGAFVGAQVSLGLAEPVLRKVFAIFLFFLSLYMYFKS